MRNYIILNGTNSNTITGLLISTLPPITQPKQRTQTEEIDGRDGDIITTLGYSAYDKEIEIGLYANYDINTVITFFNSSGTIVFSNEPDKYYNYQILDQINYEKLIRFKTAKVRLHVQPFKYPTTEATINLTTGSNIVNNIGNIYAKPVINIVGSGSIAISLNGEQIFEIDMSNNSKITIDTTKLEAYNPENAQLLNRIVTGDYSLFKIESGSNTITLEGTITTATITGYTRWL